MMASKAWSDDENNNFMPYSPASQFQVLNGGGYTEEEPFWRNQEEIVISGISVRMPESDTMDEFKERLLNGEDLVTEDSRRWEPGYYDLPRRHAKLRDLTKFDAAAFGVHPKQASTMDPQLRLLLEVAFEAIMDAGINPQEIRGTPTGVFVGCSASEMGAALTADPETVVGYSLTGCTGSMNANRLSYTFDFTGPSFAVDTACSSALLALQLAVDSIRLGKCNAALICGSHLTLTPTTALQFKRLGMLSHDGMCKSFDANGEGYVRAEGIAAIYIQKISTARRVYCTVLHAKGNTDGFKEQGVTFPSGERQAELLRQTYNEAGISPTLVNYVETHGTGTKVGDPQEANALASVFCPKERASQLLIGSVKSNMGHCEPCSALASIAKIVIAMETGYIPPNLHFTEPNPNIQGLVDGRMKVVAEKTPFPGGLIGINSFGFGGSNVHAILKPYTKLRGTVKEIDAPKLFCFGGRTVDAVESVLKYMETNSDDHNIYALLAEAANVPTNLFPYRGFMVLNATEAGLQHEVQRVHGLDKRPVWFVYSGMGTQWPGMGRDLMKFDVFRQAIGRCADVLKPHGLDVYDLIMSANSEVTSNTLYSFVCIAAIQVALTNMLKAVGLEPDGILGHSVGELGCSYGDGCLTPEETMLCAYWRGKCVQEAKLPEGAMAAIGLTWKEAKERCPPGVVAACHNAEDSVTISGPADAVKKFVEELKQQEIFAKEVRSSGVAFHSPYMQQIAPLLMEKLEAVIENPKARSARWISTSILEEDSQSELARTCSAAYHVNNLTSPVRFYEALQKIPDHAVVIEIAPHCLLQPILKGCIPHTCLSYGLMKAKHEHGADFLLNSLGKVYQAGVTVNYQRLYPRVSWPVPRGTPMIGSLIKWDHSGEWPVVSGSTNVSSGGAKPTTCSFTIDPFGPDSPDRSLLDHVIDGRPLFPFTGHVVLAWKAICKLRGLDFQKTEVVLEDVHVYRPTLLTKAVKLEVTVALGTGEFEISEGDSQGTCAAGKIMIIDEERPTYYNRASGKADDSKTITLNSSDVYKEFLLRGYEYGPEFCGILKASNGGEWATLRWNGNWISFLDTFLQTSAMRNREETLRLPVRLRYMRINPEKHFASIEKSDDGTETVHVNNDFVTLGGWSSGVEACELVVQTVQRRMHAARKPTVERVYFVHDFDDQCFQDWPEFQSNVHSYQQFCSQYAWILMRRLAAVNGLLPNAERFAELLQLHGAKEVPSEKIHGDLLSQYLSDPRCVVAQLLHKLDTTLNNGSNPMELHMNMKDVLQSHRSQLEQDFYWMASWHQRSVKPMVDLVVENTPGHFGRCAHVEPRSVALAKLCKDYMESHPLCELDWYIIGPKVAEFDDNALEQAHLEGSYEWNLDSTEPASEKFKKLDLVILDRVLHRKADIAQYLGRVKELIRDDGFVAVCEVVTHFEVDLLVQGLHEELPRLGGSGRILGTYYDYAGWMQIFKECGFNVVNAQRDGNLMTAMFLLKSIPKEGRNPILIDIDDVKEFSWVPKVQEALETRLGASSTETVWLTSNKVRDNGSLGFALCLKEENSKVLRTHMAVDVSLDSKTPALPINGPEVKRIIDRDMMSNMYRDGTWGTIRHFMVEDDKMLKYVDTTHAYLNTLIRGDLSSLAWVESDNRYFDSLDNRPAYLAMCSVYFAPLNFRDIMLATGRLPPDAIPGKFADRDSYLGMEYSGRLDATGKRVMGLCNALSTTIAADTRFMWEVPDSWSLEEASTVPVVYATAYYALVVRGRITQSDTVLIHSGSGGVGLAAIRLALSFGCEVFTTVSNEEKKKFLQARFPQLQDRHFSTSRSTDFEYHIMHETQGRGVDIVMNSLAEDKLQASVRCLAMHGRFLEIGKFDLSNNTGLGMAVFLKNISFHGILLDSLFDGDNMEGQFVKSLLSEGLQNGVIQPLPTNVFPMDRTEDAFRFMASGKHIGKVLVCVRKEEPVLHALPTPVVVRAVCRTMCHPQHVYLITGGLGGFGLELSQWLVNRGAKKLVLTSRTGIKTGYQARLCNHWRKLGVEVIVSKLDIGKEAEATELIRECQKLGPLGGVFHLAMVLRDQLFENQTVENFQESAQTKYWGTRHLDQATRALCGESLKWFVVFSSVACGRGNSGQSCYGWANSTMERVVEQRRQDGFAGMAIQWGAIGDVGVVLETLGDNSVVVGGTLPQRMPSCLQLLDTFLTWNHPVVSSFVRADTRKKKDQVSSGDVLQTIAHIMGVSDASQLDADANLADLGLDSLMGVEIRQALERDYDVVLSMKDIRTLTLNKLKDMVNSGATSRTEVASALAAADMDMSPLKFFGLRMEANDFMPTEVVVRLNTVEKGVPVFCVHSIEGVAATLQTIASKMNVPVYCLQCTPDTPMDTIESMAEFYVQNMRKIQPSGPYRLIGYSYGACIAYEMACTLQRQHLGTVSSLILLDSSHYYMQTYRKLYRAAYNVTADLTNNPIFEAELLCGVSMRFVHFDYLKTREELLALESWAARLKRAVDLCMSGGLFKNALVAQFANEAVYKKFCAADKYHPENKEKFAGAAMLIRPKIGALRVEDAGKDYGLHEIVTGTVDVHVVDGDHDSFVHGENSDKTVAIINEELSRQA